MWTERRSDANESFFIFSPWCPSDRVQHRLDKGRMCYLWPRLCRNLSFLLHSVPRLGVVVGGNFNPAQDVLISCIYIVEPKLYSYSLFIHLECNTKERTTALRFCLCQTGHSAWFGLCPVPGLRGSLPYIGYIGMCGAKGYGFLAILVSEIGYQFWPF